MTKTILKGSLVAALSIMMLLSALPVALPPAAADPTLPDCIEDITNLQTATANKVNDKDAQRLNNFKLEKAKDKLIVEPLPKIADAIKKIDDYISKISNLPDKKFLDGENIVTDDRQDLINSANGVKDCLESFL